MSELCIETIVPFSESLIVRWLQAYTKLHKKFAEEISVRLGINPISFEAFVEVGIKDPQCCLIS